MKTKSTLTVFCSLLFAVASFSQNKTAGSNSWSITGNAGTDTAINFIGTTDAVPLLIKVKNKISGYLDYSLNGNTSFGYQSSQNNARFYNTAFGYQALLNNTDANNSAVGYRALFSNTFADFNVAVGSQALYYNTNGSFNTAVGAEALFSNIEGHDNTAIGHRSLHVNQSGKYNVAVGNNALYNNNTDNNTAIGWHTLQDNTTGTLNTATGQGALQSNTIGSNNTANGVLSLHNNNEGNGNTAIGNYSLGNNYKGDYNTGLGYAANVTDRKFNNSTAIGANALIDASNKVRVGNTSVISIGGQVSWTSFSDERIKDNVKENVPGLVFINQLRPLTYHFNLKKETELLGKQDSLYWDEKYDIEKMQFTGFLAQDVDEAAKNIDYDFSGIDKSGKIMGLRYSEFVVPLVKAVQELSKQNADIKKENAELRSRLDKIEAILSVQLNTETNTDHTQITKSK